MAEAIKFSEEERNKTLATPEANQFLQDGVINPDSPEWQELPPEKQKEILEEMSAKLGTSKAALLQLRRELDTQDSPEEEDSTPEAKESSNNPNYKAGPLKEQVSYENSFEEIQDIMSSEQMGSIVKRNINLMQTKVREQWIKHFDDALLGSSVGFVYPEFEHLGRAIQPSTKVTSVDSAENILAFGQDSAAEQIDALVIQNTPESKAILKAMNESVKDETGALTTWLVSYLLLRHVGGATIHVGKAVATGGLKLLTFKGRGGINVIHLTETAYKLVDTAMSKKGGSMATQWGKLKKTLSFEGATPEAIAEAESNAKQLEYGKNAIKEQLYEKYGVGMSQEKFGEYLDKMTATGQSNIEKAQVEYARGLGIITKHLPIDISNPQLRAEELRVMALDMPASWWKRFANKFVYHIFEKGGIEKYTIGKIIAVAKVPVGSHNSQSQDFAKRFLDDTAKVEVDIGEGHKVYVHPDNVEEVKKFKQYLDADIALATQKAEMDALVEVRKLEGDIQKLRADNIPDTEQGVEEKIRQLEEAKMRYNEYKGLHDAAQSARTERTGADNEVKNNEAKLETTKENLIEAKERIRLYNEYYSLKNSYTEAEKQKNSAETKLNQEKLQVESTIKMIEGSLKSNGITGFSDFKVTTNEADFLEKARNHVRVLQTQVTAYNMNSSTPKGSKLDINATFSGVNSDVLTAGKAQDTFTTVNGDENSKKVELDGKIGELKAAGIWDSGTSSLSKTLSELQQDEKTAQQDEKTAQKNLTDAQERQKKVQAGTEKAKKAVSTHSAQSSVYKGTQRNADGTAISRDIKSEADIDAELKNAKDMKDKLDAKKKAEEARIKAEAARSTSAQKAGYTGETKPKADGAHSPESKSFFDKLTQQQTDTMTTYTDYVTRAAAKGYTMEVKDGKATLTDTTGKKFEFDMKNPTQRAEFFKKIK